MSKVKIEITADDLIVRLEKMYAAIGVAFSKSTNGLQWEPVAKKSGQGWKLDLDRGTTQASLEVEAMTAIHFVSTFWDHALPYFTKVRGISDDEVGEVPKKCLALKILRDLDNSDKHPETPANWSGVHPRLAKFRNVIVSKRGLGVHVSDKGFTPYFNKDARLCVYGEIYNSSKQTGLMTLNQALSEGVLAWEAFLRKHGLIE